MARKLNNHNPKPNDHGKRSKRKKALKQRGRPMRRRTRTLVMAVVLGLLGLLAVVLRPQSALPPSAALPKQTGLLKPELLSMIQRYADAVRANPNDPRAHATLGLVYEANELWIEARESFAQAQALQPDEPMWVYHTVMAAQTLGEYDSALELLQVAALRFPDFAPIHHRFGEVLLDQGQLEAAAGAFEQTIRLIPQHCAGYVGLADVMLRRQAHARAAELLERAVQISPSYAPAHHLLGLAYRGMGRNEDAARELVLGANAKKRYLVDEWGEKAIDFVASIHGRVDHAARLMEAGRLNDAIRKLEEMLQSHPNEFRVLRMLGPAYIKAGRNVDALDVLRRAIRIDETDLENYINIAWCYRQMQKMNDALREADQAIGRFPDAWAAHYARALALEALNRRDEAYEALTESIRLHAADPAVYVTAGQAAEALNRIDSALEYYRTALRRRPDFTPASVRLARLCLRFSHREEALHVIQAALTHAPSDPDLLELKERVGGH